MSREGYWDLQEVQVWPEVGFPGWSHAAAHRNSGRSTEWEGVMKNGAGGGAVELQPRALAEG